jgi:hypothetical protein
VQCRIVWCSALSFEMGWTTDIVTDVDVEE